MVRAKVVVVALMALFLMVGVFWMANSAPADGLGSAIRSGDLEAVKAAVDAGADVNAADAQQMTPIGLAALEGHADIVDYLAGKGANVEGNDADGYTPLMRAANRQRIGAMKVLLKHGANPSAKGAAGFDALMLAKPIGPDDPDLETKVAVISLLQARLADVRNQPIAPIDSTNPRVAPPPATPTVPPVVATQIVQGAPPPPLSLYGPAPTPPIVPKPVTPQPVAPQPSTPAPGPPLVDVNGPPPIAPSAPQPVAQPQGTQPAPGQLIEVNWGGGWFKASIVQVKDGKCLIHYDLYGDDWNEWVGPERMRARGAGDNPNAPKPAPAVLPVGEVKLSGLYFHQVTVTVFLGRHGGAGNQHQEYLHYYFFSDGRVFFGVPPAGMVSANPTAADFAALNQIAPNKCGTYSISGGTIRIATPDNPSWSKSFALLAQGDVSRVKIDGWDAYKVAPFKENQALAGRYTSLGSVGNGGRAYIVSSSTFTFSADGGVLVENVANLEASGDRKLDHVEIDGHAMTNKSGQYRLSGNKLTLTFANGQSKVVTAFPLGEGVSPEWIGIDGGVFSLQSGK